jgi:hypothetical protein
MSVSVSLEGPVEKLGDDLVILIPLESGGDALAPLAKGIGIVERVWLKVTIQPWLAERLRIEVGSLVVVDNFDGKFRITRSTKNDGVDTDVVV